MKRGFRGYRTNCPQFDVWGISVNAPCIQPYFIEPGPMGIDVNTVPMPYDWQGAVANTNKGSGPKTEETIPQLFPRLDGNVWPFFAAKVPSSYPYGCDKNSPRSSAEDNSWSVGLGTVMEHLYTSGSGTHENSMYWRWVYQSRACSVDWGQRYVTYRYSSVFNQGLFSVFDQYPTESQQMGTIAVVDVINKTVPIVLDFDNRRFTVDGIFGDHISDATSMETAVSGNFFLMPNTFVPMYNSYSIPLQPAAQCLSFGAEYMIYSTYNPNSQNPAWVVSRVKYRGTRLGITPMAEVFSSQTLQVDRDTYQNKLLIALPTCRVFIDTSAAQPDECWVAAVSESSAVPKLATGRWLNKDYWEAGSDERYDFADGTLRDDEVENWIINMDSASSAYKQPIAGERWEDIRVRCYNHVHGQDLLLFTTSAGDTAKVSTPTATFEDGSLNQGLPEGITFDAGNVQNGWALSTDDKYAGTYSLKSGGNDTMLKQVVTITVNVTQNNSDFSFWWLHDNRMWPTNFPEVNEWFEFSIDGEVYLRVDHAAGPFLPATYETWQQFKLSVDTPTKLLSAGTHTFSWVHNRATTSVGNAHLATYIDDVEFPEIMLSDDVDAKNRWFYAYGKVRRAKYWAWKKQDDEDTTEVDPSRSSRTTPDFITMDRQGRIYYGNPHYVCRILIDDDGNDHIDESFGSGRFTGDAGGYVQFTATTNIEPEPSPCLDPSWIAPDIIDDPPWGSFQIMPVLDGIQIRGVNAAIRDATQDPLSKHLYDFKTTLHGLKKEEFRDFLKSIGRWSQRPSGWTVSDSGKQLVPHLEVIWRPTSQATAWPEKEPYDSPPYRSDFAKSTINDPAIAAWVGAGRGGSLRPRELFLLNKNSNKPRWSHVNYVIPRGYSDALTQFPQYVWWHAVGNDPPPWDGSGDVPDGYWHPDDPPEYAAGLGVAGGPYPSVQWYLIQARFDPTGWRWLAWRQQGAWFDNILCPEEYVEDEEVETQIWRWQIEDQKNFWVFTDFDAVDEGQMNCYAARTEMST